MFIHSTQKQRSYFFLPILHELSFSFLPLLSLSSLDSTSKCLQVAYRACRCEIFTFSMRFFSSPSPPWASRCGSSEKKRREIQHCPQSQSREVWISLMTHLCNFVVARACRSGPAKVEGNARGIQLRPQVMLYYVSLALAVSTPLAITVPYHCEPRGDAYVCFASSPAVLCTPSLARPISKRNTEDVSRRAEKPKPKNTRSTRGIFLAAYSTFSCLSLRISVHFSRVTIFSGSFSACYVLHTIAYGRIIAFTESQDGFPFDSAKRFLARANYGRIIPIARYATTNEGRAYKNHMR